jgi:hypothetical protein
LNNPADNELTSLRRESAVFLDAASKVYGSGPNAFYAASEVTLAA